MTVDEKTATPDPGASGYLKHGIAVVLLDTIVLFALAWLLPGFAIDGIWAGVATAVLIGLLNAIVWPLVVRLTLPVAVTVSEHSFSMPQSLAWS